MAHNILDNTSSHNLLGLPCKLIQHTLTGESWSVYHTVKQHGNEAIGKDSLAAVNSDCLVFLSLSDTQCFVNTSLSSLTSYSYYVETSSVLGSTRSIAVIYTAELEVSEEHLNLTHAIFVGSDSVILSWKGKPLWSYRGGWFITHTHGQCRTLCLLRRSGNPSYHWNLAPFNQYCLSVQGCTRGGCLHSLPIVVTTAQAPPQRLQPPAIWKISSAEPHVGWALSGAQNGNA